MSEITKIEEASQDQMAGQKPVELKISFTTTEVAFKAADVTGKPEVKLTGHLVLFRKYLMPTPEGGHTPVGLGGELSTPFSVSLNQELLDTLLPQTDISKLTQTDAVGLLTTILTQHVGPIPKAPEEYKGPEPTTVEEVEETEVELPNIYRIEDQQDIHTHWDGETDLEDIVRFEDL